MVLTVGADPDANYNEMYRRRKCVGVDPGVNRYEVCRQRVDGPRPGAEVGLPCSVAGGSARARAAAFANST
jgi:hypothetical protein